MIAKPIQPYLYGFAQVAAWIVIGVAMIASILGGAHFLDRKKEEHDILEEIESNKKASRLS